MTRQTVPARMAAVLVAVLLAAACSGGGDEPLDAASETTGDREPTTDADQGQDTTDAGPTTAGDADPTEPTPTDDTADDAAPAGEGSSSSTPTTSQPATTSEAEAGGAASTTTAPEETGEAAPARPIVPRSGSYTYERTTTTDEGSETERHDAEVERLSGDDRSGRVQFTTESDQGTLISDTTVSDRGTLVEHSLIQSPLGEIDCDWEPDWLLHGAFARGTTWTIDTSCQDTSTGLEVDVAISGSGTVVGWEPVDVDGTAVTAWVLETTTVTEFTVSSPTVNGTQRSESTSRTWIDPDLGMQVRDETRSTESGDFENGTSEIVNVFVGFSPA